MFLLLLVKNLSFNIYNLPLMVKILKNNQNDFDDKHYNLDAGTLVTKSSLCENVYSPKERTIICGTTSCISENFINCVVFTITSPLTQST